MYVALIICHAKCMHCAILPSVACLAVPYFSALSHKCLIYEREKSYWTFYFLYNICHSAKKSVKYCRSVHRSLVLSYFNETWIVSTDFRKTLECKILWESIEWEHSFTVQVDGWTGRHTEVTKLRVTFHNSMNTPKNEYLCSAVGVQN